MYVNLRNKKMFNFFVKNLKSTSFVFLLDNSLLTYLKYEQ